MFVGEAVPFILGAIVCLSYAPVPIVAAVLALLIVCVIVGNLRITTSQLCLRIRGPLYDDGQRLAFEAADRPGIPGLDTDVGLIYHVAQQGRSVDLFAELDVPISEVCDLIQRRLAEMEISGQYTDDQWGRYRRIATTDAIITAVGANNSYIRVVDVLRERSIWDLVFHDEHF